MAARRRDRVGFAVDSSGWPINGLRHRPDGEATGWYVWLGEELSAADDFFSPLHVCHLDDLLSMVVPYLSLPTGWRFLIARGYEDVWYDERLLDLSGD